MKYKSWIFCILIISPVFAHGASMCIPEQTGRDSVAYVRGKGATTSVYGNRHHWGRGTNCRVVNGTGVADRPIMCDEPTIYGEGHCSKSGTYPSDDWEEFGYYCWCRITDMKTTEKDTNGKYIVAPKNGAWVLLRRDASCDWHCTYVCSGAYNFSAGYLKTMMISEEKNL